MGKSECEIQLPLPRAADQKVIAVNPDPEVEEQVTFPIKAALHHDTGMIPPKGIHLVCGNKAYPYLPRGWKGSCYLASVFPDSKIRTTFHHTSTPQRHRRSVSDVADPAGWAGVTTRLGVIKGQWWEKALGVFIYYTRKQFCRHARM